MTCVRTALLLPANCTQLTAVCVVSSELHYCGRRKRQTVAHRTNWAKNEHNVNYLTADYETEEFLFIYLLMIYLNTTSVDLYW